MHIGAYPAWVTWTPDEIVAERDARNMTQAEMAKAIGVSVRALSNWETGKVEPRGINRRKLQDFLNNTTATPTAEPKLLHLASAAELAMEIYNRLTRAEGEIRAAPPARLVDNPRVVRGPAAAPPRTDKSVSD